MRNGLLTCFILPTYAFAYMVHASCFKIHLSFKRRPNFFKGEKSTKLNKIWLVGEDPSHPENPQPPRYPPNKLIFFDMQKCKINHSKLKCYAYWWGKNLTVKYISVHHDEKKLFVYIFLHSQKVHGRTLWTYISFKNKIMIFRKWDDNWTRIYQFQGYQKSSRWSLESCFPKSEN